MRVALFVLLAASSGAAQAKPIAEMIRLGPIAEIRSGQTEEELSQCIAAATGWSRHLEQVSVPSGTAYVPVAPKAPLLVSLEPLFVFVINEENGERVARLYNQKGRGWAKFAAKFTSCSPGSALQGTPPQTKLRAGSPARTDPGSTSDGQ